MIVVETLYQSGLKKKKEEKGALGGMPKVIGTRAGGWGGHVGGTVPNLIIEAKQKTHRHGSSGIKRMDSGGKPKKGEHLGGDRAARKRKNTGRNS